MFPKLIFLKGAILQDFNFKRLTQGSNSKNGLELYQLLEQFVDKDELYKKHVICYGEGVSTDFKVIIMNDVNDYSIITVGTDNVSNNDVIAKFFTDNINS